MKNSTLVIKAIVNKFSELNGANFVGIREYTSKGTGEVSNHVVNAGFSYANAVKKDLNALQTATNEDIKAIEKLGFDVELINKAIAKLSTSFINNQNKETASTGSEAQKNAFISITKSIKLHIETGNIFVYALSVSKEVIKKGTYKTVNSRDLTKCQNAIKKHFNFSTAKFRNFIVTENHFSSVKISGDLLSI